MRCLERYIYKELLSPVLFGVVAFTLIFVAADLFFMLARLLVDGTVGLGTVMRLFVLGLPRIVALTLPMSTLLGILLCYSTFSASSEIVAMRAAGLSLIGIMTPALIVALIVSGATFAFNEKVVPGANRRFEEIMWEIGKRSNPFIQRNLVLREFERGVLTRLVFADTYDAEKEQFSRVTMQEFEDGRLVRITEAASARWDESAWLFEDGISYNVVDGDRVVSVRFARQEGRIAYTPKEVARGGLSPDEMSASELRQHVRRLKEQGQDVTKLLVEYYLKFAIPFAGMVFGLVAAPLGITTHRSSTSRGFGMSILIIFVYYVIMSLSCALAERGSIPPMLGAWFSNILFGSIGGLMMVKKS
ncbi:MAG: YjgP/YjgQ family permease [Firmicutes bacterium]|nr:YjgP/YjgQ family permease [Bacillota bacterium]